tara:strand:- start:25941 stop:27428 length:1488 start_codon:yes stop_codon:yes gene_type:complete
MIRIASTLLVLAGLLSASLTCQGRPEGAPKFSKKQLVKAFDSDQNGRLTGDERTAAIQWIHEDLKKNPPRRRGSRPAPESELKPYKVAKDSVQRYGDHDLYDTSVVRTIFIDFANANWSEDMKLFYRTDIDEPATVTVDGVVYPGVGVHFRGSSSYFSVVNRPKKSMSLSFDHENKEQRLAGCKAVNLLSAHADPSYMRTVLFAHIAGNYVKMPKACFVHLVINGESWGLYINDQQLNKDFIEQAFETRKGSRWKIGPNFNGESALAYQGPDRANYESKYELKSGPKKKSWRALIKLCSTLSESSPSELEKNLAAMLDIDHALWFLALDNVLMDGDGYHYRGSDYALYLHPNGKFYPLFRDNNESFNYGGGPGGFGRDGGSRTRSRGAVMDPLKLVDEERAALSSKLLAVPKWREQYLDRCRELRDTWVDWQRVGPIVAGWRVMIEPIVSKDDKGLYGYAAFKEGLGAGSERTPGLEKFFQERRAFLDETPSLKK